MKILIVSPFYSPFALVGAKRMVSLSKYLTDQGHMITVWAHDIETLKNMVSEECLCSKDPENINIIRFGISDNSSLSKLLYPLQYFKQICDCKKAAKQQLYDGDYDLVLLTCGPLYTQNVIAKFIKKQKIPLVLDMRDLDVLSGKGTKKNLIVRLIQNIVWYVQQFLPEKKCMKLAKKVVGVVPAQVAEICDAYKISKDKVSIIYNGFDDSALVNVKPVRKKNTVKRIGYFGKLMYYSPERAIMMLKAINKLRCEGYNIELFHVGERNSFVNKTILNLQLDPKIYYATGALDYCEGVAYMLSSDLLFIEYRDMNGLGTKLFDYIYCNKPIVAISPQKAALSVLVDSFENGFACDSIEDAYIFIKKILDNDISVLDANVDRYRYSRSIQNSNYEKLLQEVIDQYTKD